MRILCTNDDGIHAPGLKVVEQIARELSDDVWVVAPELDQSGVSHSLSLNDPLRLREVGPRHFAVRGTPTDCVIMGARHILGAKLPDLVLSGVNKGRNVAEDVVYSGTIAGALEGTILGLPSFALSQEFTLEYNCLIIKIFSMSNINAKIEVETTPRLVTKVYEKLQNKISTFRKATDTPSQYVKIFSLDISMRVQILVQIML